MYQVRGVLGQISVAMEGETGKTASSKLLYPKQYLQNETDGQKNFERTCAYLSETEESKPDPDGLKSQMGAILNHNMSRKKLMALKETGIPIMITCGNKDIVISPRASDYLIKVS